MTKKLYLESPSLFGDAVVTDVFPDGSDTVVRLDETLFHPQGGGQKADSGYIEDAKVLHVRHADGGEVDHLIEGPAPTIGERVEIRVDEERRRLHARLHSAGHLIADLVNELQAEVVAVRGHHWPLEARVEFAGAPKDVEALGAGLELRLQRAVEASLPFDIVGDPYSDRKLKIGYFAAVPCGGTHISGAAELRSVRILRVRVKKGALRVSYDVAP